MTASTISLHADFRTTFGRLLARLGAQFRHAIALSAAPYMHGLPPL